MSLRYCIVFILVIATKNAIAQNPNLCNKSSLFSVFLSQDTVNNPWKIQKANQLKESAQLVSNTAYNDAKWIPAIVPGTVLTSLVENKSLPNPYFGDVNKRSLHQIPDMADSGREYYHYWYRKQFNVPTSFQNKKHIWLKLHGINYRASIWLNGKHVGDMAGMFNTQTFDVTTIINKNNVLAIDVSPVDVPGQSGLKKEKRTRAIGENSNGGDGLIGENVTMLMTAGWDFTFVDGIRDRNTGIWRDVELFATDDILLKNPFVVSSLPLPDTSYSKEEISVEIQNTSSSGQSGILKGEIKELGIKFQKEITLYPKEKKQILFSPDEYKQLVINHPKLWWPVNKGQQQLYTLTFSFEATNRSISHTVQTSFGIREIRSDQNTPDRSRRFVVNGHPMFVRGSNWIPETMQRNSAKRTLAELKYTRQAGINLLRLWGGGVSESDYFFQLCDEMGILVWSEFWITGDTRMPTDSILYLKNLESTIKRIRNHPSLAYYVSSNESTEVYGAKEKIYSLDSSRGYQQQSECCGVHDGSPYKYENPMQYFENTASQRGSRIDGFNPEYGTPILPVVESLKKMMPLKDLWPINDSVWNYMDGGGFHQMTTLYNNAVNQFGKSSSIDEYARKAQVVGAMNYRSIWEVWNYNKFGWGDRFSSGFLFWYHNSPQPQVCSRMYDWYLEPTAALYYSQNGLQPLHPQFDYLKNTVSVYNDFRNSINNYSVEAEVYSLDAKKLWSKYAKINIPADGLVKDIFKIEFPKEISQVHFIKLKLKDANNKIVSDAFYWRSNDSYKGAFTLTGPAVSGFESLEHLPKTKLDTKIVSNKNGLDILVSNNSPSISFFTQLKLRNTDGTTISPTYYSDNFFNLLPGESKKITIQFDKENISTETYNLIVDGWNVIPKTFSYKKY